MWKSVFVEDEAWDACGEDGVGAAEGYLGGEGPYIGGRDEEGEEGDGECGGVGFAE